MPADFYLATAAIHAENVTDGLPVILLVKGVLVNGNICSREEYLEKAPVAGTLEKLAARLCPPEEDEMPKGAGTEEDPRVVPIPNFIHLRNAQTRLPGSTPLPADGTGNYARIALESIDGFMWGELKVSPA